MLVKLYSCWLFVCGYFKYQFGSLGKGIVCVIIHHNVINGCSVVVLLLRDRKTHNSLYKFILIGDYVFTLVFLILILIHYVKTISILHWFYHCIWFLAIIGSIFNVSLYHILINVSLQKLDFFKIPQTNYFFLMFFHY